MYYPLFLNLEHARCLVVGGGEVGLRKTQGLLAANPAEVLVLDIAPLSPAWDDLRHHARLRVEQRSFVPEDIQGCSLVFACTGQRTVNAAVASSCAKANIWCNCTDAPREGNCIVPAVARSEKLDTQNSVAQHSLVAALSTGGASPAWARVLRTELEEWLRARAAMTTLLGRLRPLLLAMKHDTGHNTQIFRALVHSPLREKLQEGKAEQCQTLLQELLPDALHPHIPELLHDIL